MSLLGKRLQQMREQLSMSQTDFAKALGLSRSAVSMYERGRREPSFDLVVMMAVVLCTTPSYLLGWIDDPNPMYGKSFKQIEDENPDILAKRLEYEKEEKIPTTQPTSNGEFASYREQLRRQPGARMLLDAADDATDQEIEQWVNVINALKKKPYDD